MLRLDFARRLPLSYVEVDHSIFRVSVNRMKQPSAVLPAKNGSRVEASIYTDRDNALAVGMRAVGMNPGCAIMVGLRMRVRAPGRSGCVGGCRCQSDKGEKQERRDLQNRIHLWILPSYTYVTRQATGWIRKNGNGAKVPGQ